MDRLAAAKAVSGLVQFENGARVMMEFTDADADSFAAGDAVSMRLRIKSHDRRRGFRTYFWTAAPMQRAQIGAPFNSVAAVSILGRLN